MTPMERMKTVAGLDNGVQSSVHGRRASSGSGSKDDLAKLPDDAQVIVFSHSPLYKLYKTWNFWTDDADEVQAILKRFKQVVVIHGHTHQLLTNRIGNIHFHGLLSTAWPWPYAPEGMPELTIQMSRPDPFNPNDGCGDGEVHVHPDGLVDKVYSLWNRNPITVSRTYMASWGKERRPAQAQPAVPTEPRSRRRTMNTHRSMRYRRPPCRRHDLVLLLAAIVAGCGQESAAAKTAAEDSAIDPPPMPSAAVRRGRRAKPPRPRRLPTKPVEVGVLRRRATRSRSPRT